MEHFVYSQTEMQRMVIDQMKKQQDFFEKQDKIRTDQTAVRLPKWRHSMVIKLNGQNFGTLTNAQYIITRTCLEQKK